MLRWVYIQLIWLHPAPFRWRFGDDMLDDFDRAALPNKPRYFADAVSSLARQWLLRPEFLHPEPAPLQPGEAPLFQTIADYKPQPAALIHGGFLAVLSIFAAVILIGEGVHHARPYLIGMHLSKSSPLPVDRNSVAASDLDTTIKLPLDHAEAWLKLARPYFASMPVLRALDADPDFTLSPWEIATASTALRKIDLNYDGLLTAEECGFRIQASSVNLPWLAQVHRRYMSFHPVLAALDSDHDGEISAQEIALAPMLLKALDRNDDGYLTVDELLPAEMVIRAGLEGRGN